MLKINSKLKSKASEALFSKLNEWTFTISQGIRSTRYLSQSLLGTILLERQPSEEQRQFLASPALTLQALWSLLREDAKNISMGVYRAPAKWRESTYDFTKTSLMAIRDLYHVKRREKERNVVDIPNDPLIEDLPVYYRQNFHFQTDGWLSERSAELYDHQVEVIFGGAAGAMRRQALIPFRVYLEEKNLIHLISQVKVLDLAAGTGSFSAELKNNYPDIHLTLNDLSPYYLKKARKRLTNYYRTDFVEANAEKLPFKDASFDVVVCIYLFHELPRRVRLVVMNEIRRVLKPGGLFIFEDSIQLGDLAGFDGSLKHFPVHYHEPYYLDYVSRPLADFIEPSHWIELSTKIAFLSKVVAFEKRVDPS